MNEKTRRNLIHDINAVFVAKIDYMHADRKWIDIEFKKDTEITADDFPHLLTIADGYNVTVNIYPMSKQRLGIYLKEAK